MNLSQNKSTKTIFNRKLSHDFFIGKKFEAGIVLCGTEIKSVRQGNVTLTESFIRLDRNGRPVWINAYISDYKFGNTANHEPSRSRFLLLTRKEINELRGALERKGESIFPVQLYFKNGLAKLEIAICKAKKLFDKRRDLKEKAEKRDVERNFHQKYS